MILRNVYSYSQIQFSSKGSDSVYLNGEVYWKTFIGSCLQLDQSFFNTISDIQNKDSRKKMSGNGRSRMILTYEAHIRAKWMCQKHQYIDNVTTLRCHIKGWRHLLLPGYRTLSTMYQVDGQNVRHADIHSAICKVQVLV